MMQMGNNMHDEGKGGHVVSRGTGMIQGKRQAQRQCEGQVVEGLWGHRQGQAPREGADEGVNGSMCR